MDREGFGWGTESIRYAAEELPSLEDRLTEIFENDPSKNNFRSAQLIRDYGEETGRTSLSAHGRGTMDSTPIFSTLIRI